MRTLPVEIRNRDTIGETMAFKKQKTEAIQPQQSLGTSLGAKVAVKVELDEESLKKALESQDTDSS